MTANEHALALFDKGFKVFPIHQNGKKPAFDGWQNWAENSTRENVWHYGLEHPNTNWGVYCGASKLTILDLDVKRAEANGIESLKGLLNAVNIPALKTYTVKTPSGGYHLYFSGEYRTSAGALGLGIDTRGVGGYVIAPGSVISGVTYTVSQDAPIVPLPEPLVQLLAKQAPKVLDDEDLVLEGERNDTLASLAGSMRSRGMGYESILAALQAVNDHQLADPLPDTEVTTIAASVARYAPEHAVAASDFLEAPKIWATKASEIKPSSIKPRDWLMDRRYIGGHISVVIAPGGIGKSILTMLDAVAIATGKPLTGFNVVKPAPVWIYNTEDPSDELKRRMVALALHHAIPLTELENVFLTSGREIPLILAKAGRDGIAINKNAIDSIVAYIKYNKIRVMLADPFVRTHEVSENDNMQIDKVVWVFQRIADRTGCAIGVVHHARKAGAGGKVDMDSARGASALVNAARVAHVLQTMGETDATRFGVGHVNRSWYMRLDNAKANLQPPANTAHWFRKVSVDLPNGDAVGVIECADLVDCTAEKASEEFIADARDIATVLTKYVKPGSKIKALDAWIMLAGAIPHLADLSDKRGRIRLNSLIQSGKCETDTCRISYLAEGTDDRPRHWFTCEAKPEMDFLT